MPFSKKNDHRFRRIVLLVAPSARTMEGMADYVAGDKRWAFELIPQRSESAIAQLHADPPDGVIAYVPDIELADELARLPCPVLNFSGGLKDSPLTCVRVDDLAVGRMAARHLWDCGLRSLACVHFGNRQFAYARRDGFLLEAGELGLQPATFELELLVPPEQRRRTTADDTAIADWIAGLPKPVGVFAVNDTLGWRLSSICLERRIHVPEQVAILGMDDTPGVCQLVRPTLSSIIPPWEAIGYECAAALDRMMSTGVRESGDILIPPLGIATRQSTDVMAVPDGKMADAIRFIRTAAQDGINVDDVVAHVRMSRRALELKFRRFLSRTPLDEIHRVRVDMVKRLLADTRLSPEVIAERTGFASVRWMAEVFREQTGETLGQYRRGRSARVGGSERRGGTEA